MQAPKTRPVGIIRAARSTFLFASLSLPLARHLSCFSAASHRMAEALPLSYVTAQEIRCLLHWLSGWAPAQRERFLRDLVDKAVPCKVLPLLEGLAGLSMEPGKPPSIYECQMRLWDQWFRGWSEAERNEFVRQLEELEPSLASRFYQEVAKTAGQE